MARGRFIVVEGPDGAGKSTLARWLARRLRATGRRVVAVREPGGTRVAEAARTVALRFPHAMAPAAELFLMLVARADLVERVIRPALADGGIVVADRFDLSTVAYQVAGGGMARGGVRVANGLATRGLRPDLTLVLDVPLGVGRLRQRRSGKRQDRFERRGDAYHARVLRAYRNARGPGVVHIDASQSQQAVRIAAWQVVTRVVLNSRGMS